MTLRSPNSTSSPYTTLFRSHWSDGKLSEASGAMVGPNDVLTAAHVVQREGLQLLGLDVLPGYKGDGLANTPSVEGHTAHGRYSTDNIDDVIINSFPGHDHDFLTDQQSSSDLALIGLPVNLGKLTGWFGLEGNAPE